MANGSIFGNQETPPGVADDLALVTEGFQEGAALSFQFEGVGFNEKGDIRTAEELSTADEDIALCAIDIDLDEDGSGGRDIEVVQSRGVC